MLDRLLAAGGALDRITAPGGVLDRILEPGGLADRMLTDDGFVEKLIAQGGTLDQLIELGETLESIRPRLVQLAELIPELSASVDALGRSVTPLGELANRLPLSRRRRSGPPPDRPAAVRQAGPRRTPPGRRGRVAPGQRPGLGPVRRRVPGHPRRRSSATPASCGARRGSPRTRPACSATSGTRTSSRWGPAPGSAHAGCAPAAAAAIGIDLSHRQLQHSRRIDDETGIAVPAVLGTATALPFADDSFDVVFSSFGALQFVGDIDDAVAETARVLRPGGRYAFSITHPTRWMFPDDPGPRRARGQPVLLGPHAVRRGRRRCRHGVVRRAPPHPRRLGRACWPGTASGSPTCSSRSGPRATTGSGVAGRPSAAGSRPGPRCSARTGSPG